MLDPRTVSSAYVRTLLATVEAQGVSADQVLQGLPVDAAEARRVEIAVSEALQEARTPDLGGTATTRQVGDAVLGRLAV